MVLSVASGHSSRYFTEAVAKGRENYYTGAVAAGEPPGRWYGKGAAKHGLSGLVDAQDMEALYERFVDPSDPGFKDPTKWDEASKLGHTGLNLRKADQIYRELLDAEPGADAERREQLRVLASKQERHNVAFHDVTYNVQKSITVMHTAFEAMQVKAQGAGNVEEAEAWGKFKKAVEDAIWAGNKAAMDYLQAHAGYTRIGSHGGKGGRWADAHEWTIASFFQHDSRDHDPHLHIHNGVLNRVQGPDGQWITIDGKALRAVKPAAGALADRVTQEFLIASIGTMFRMRPDGKAREVVGIPQEVMDLFSTRRRAITPKLRELADAFEAKHGSPPNALQMHYLAQQATLATRRSKSHTGQTREQMLEGWENQLRKLVDGGLAQVANDALAARPAELTPDSWSPTEVIDTALAALQAKRSTFTESDLVAEISNALPDYLGITDAQEIADLLTGLRDKAMKLVVPLDAARPGDALLPDAFRLDNGDSAFDAPARKRYATPEHLHIEHLLTAATAQRDARVALSSDAARRYLAGLAKVGIELGPDQAAAIEGILTSGARIESLVGPAGTGKSFVVGVLAKAWQDPRLWHSTTDADTAAGVEPGAGRPRQVVGLAASQLAAEVLTGEGVSATNTARWLAAQTRLADGRGKPEDQQWELRPGDLVVVDESSMADTASLDAVRARVEAVGAKMLPTGDYRQLGATGAGGGMQMMAEAGNAYELTEARRFTNAWERDASLRLRACDPTVLAEYHKNGRIVDAGTAEQAERSTAAAWLADTLNGKHAVLVVDDNQQVGRINGHLHAELVRLGKVEEGGVHLGRDGNWASVGDVVRGRRLAWELVGHEGNKRPPMTSQQYRVLKTREDGSMLVAEIRTTSGSAEGETHGERLVLPASYVAEDLTLGYACTVHAAEGLSVDTDHQIVTARTTANALYPGATRGRESNTLHVVTQAASTGIDAETGDTAQAPRRNPKAILEEILEAARPELSATDTATEDAAEAGNVQTPVDRLRETCEVAVAERTGRWLDELVDAGHLSAHDRARLAAEDAGKKLSPLLRRLEIAGHDPREVLASAVAQKTLAGSHEISSVIYGRITKRELDLDPRGDRFTDWIPTTGDRQFDQYLTALAEAADTRRGELGEQAAQQPPAWAVEAFGPVPTDPDQRAGWVDRAGQVAVYREQMGYDDPTDAIGRPPKPGLIEPYAAYRSAWRALGRPDSATDEQQMSDGQLRLRKRAWQREQAWAPPNVANKLAGTIQAAEHHRRTATLRAAEAAATTDDAEREKLTEEADAHSSLAQLLEDELPTLRELDDTYKQWVEHTATTRNLGERADAELVNRRATDEAPESQVTAQEWLQAHQEAMADEDAHRPITEADLADPDVEQQPDANSRSDRVAAEPEPDVREHATREPLTVDEDEVREYTLSETKDAVAAARRAVAELERRRAADAGREAEEHERSERLTRWHTDDQTTELQQQSSYDEAGAAL